MRQKTIFTVGVFDMLHVGHILLFKRAKALGEKLIVAVQESDFILKYKPEATIVNDTETRRVMVGAIRYVDATVPYCDVDTIVPQIQFDTFVVGPDQNHAGFQKAIQWCKDNGRDVVVLPRTDGICSSMLKNLIESETNIQLD